MKSAEQELHLHIKRFIKALLPNSESVRYGNVESIQPGVMMENGSEFIKGTIDYKKDPQLKSYRSFKISLEDLNEFDPETSNIYDLVRFRERANF